MEHLQSQSWNLKRILSLIHHLYAFICEFMLLNLIVLFNNELKNYLKYKYDIFVERINLSICRSNLFNVFWLKINRKQTFFISKLTVRGEHLIPKSFLCAVLLQNN